jgi:hypothetical protein
LGTFPATLRFFWKAVNAQSAFVKDAKGKMTAFIGKTGKNRSAED